MRIELNKMFKIARPDSSQNFGQHKTMDLTILCIQKGNTVFFSNHTHIKQI